MKPEISITEQESKQFELPTRLPILTLRDVIVFPFMIFPVLVGRESSLRATYAAMERDRYIFLVAQKNPAVDEPTENDLYKEGTIAKITQTLKLPNGWVKIV
ncbi:MAG: LON peptidase substrate-binding domain-containing protein, partial [Ignavibacteriae bacterium]|nr:LON peptidase substrate-binding domain-containing protein [Ignavibacteriota bacterium]